MELIIWILLISIFGIIALGAIYLFLLLLGFLLFMGGLRDENHFEKEL
jgi:hypothetical protein